MDCLHGCLHAVGDSTGFLSAALNPQAGYVRTGIHSAVCKSEPRFGLCSNAGIWVKYRGGGVTFVSSGLAVAFMKQR